MKPIVISIFVCLFSASALAQTKTYLFLGPQATSANYKIEDVKQDASAKAGGMAGVSLKVPFDNQLFFYPSVYYSLKGYKVDFNKRAFPPTELAINNNTTIHTIEFCPMFHIELSKKPSNYFVRFGPAVDGVISGKESFDTVTVGATGRISRPMVFSFGDYGRISASLNFHFGYESQRGWMIFAFYNHGIGSMNNADYGPRILHRIAGFSAGWRIR